MLKHSADRRSLLWALWLLPATALAHVLWPSVSGYLLPLSLYCGYSAGVLTHNHNHNPIFTSRRWNQLYALWLSVFYGYPIFGWIPTHNQNHHTYRNGPGDTTRTTRLSVRNTWLLACSYFFVSAYFQAKPVRDYVRQCRQRRPHLFRQIKLQWAALVAVHAAFLGGALALHGALGGARVYLCALGIPCGFALWSMMFTNYLQHVHCSPASEHNHSRNFTGSFANYWLFNNGYHTVHHEFPGAHWSTLPALHLRRAHLIHPSLNQRSLALFCGRTYFLGWLRPRFRTQALDVAGSSPWRHPLGAEQREGSTLPAARGLHGPETA